MFGFTFLFPPTFFLGRNVICFSGGASWDGWWRQGLGELGPSGALQVDWISLPGLPLPSTPPPRGSRQSQTKKGIKEKGRSWRTED